MKWFVFQIKGRPNGKLLAESEEQAREQLMLMYVGGVQYISNPNDVLLSHVEEYKR
jgi:hypothetical protein